MKRNLFFLPKCKDVDPLFQNGTLHYYQDFFVSRLCLLCFFLVTLIFFYLFDIIILISYISWCFNVYCMLFNLFTFFVSLLSQFTLFLFSSDLFWSYVESFPHLDKFWYFYLYLKLSNQSLNNASRVLKTYCIFKSLTTV